MAGEKNASIHAGHRRGMKEQFLKQGVSGMRDHQILELLLFYAVPRVDVNPLAHRLVEHFGSLAGVFHATYDQLLEVEGVGPSVATLLLLVPAASARYLEESANVDRQIVSPWQMKDLLEPLFFGQRDEVAYLVCMDGKSKVLATRKLGEGAVDAVPIAARKVLEAALSCNASRVVLAHNHVSGVALWSPADLDTTLRLKRLLAETGIVLVDHVILAGGDMVSMAESGLLGG